MATKPSLASLPSGARDLGSQLARAGPRAWRSARRRVDRRRQQLDRAAGDRHRRRRASPLGRRVAGPGGRAARRGRRSRRSRSRRSRAGYALAGLDAGAVAPGAQRLHGLDHVADRALGLGVAQRVLRRPGMRPDASRPSVAGHVRPQLLGDERDHRVGERERLAQHVQQRAPDTVVVELAALDQLQVPVAQLAVDEVVEAERGLGEVEALDARRGRRPCACRRDRIQRSSTVARPRRGLARRARPSVSSTKRDALKSLLASAWPCSIFSSLKRTSWVEDIASRPKRTASAPWALDHVQRVDAGAQRLAHPPAVGRLDDRVHVDVRERDVARELEAHHHHAGDPQEQDVARGREHVGRVEGAQLGRVARASRAWRTATAPS